MSTLRRTSLHDFNAARGARFVDFAGWEMPVQFKSILDEHRAVRAAAGLFDVSHMGELVVRGRGAGGFLDRLLTNDVSRLTPGGVLYSPMCHPTGGVVDDLLVYMRAPDDYLLCVNASNTAKDFAWIRRHVGEFSGEIEDQSAQWALLALQGPRSRAILEKLTPVPLAELHYYRFAEAPVAGVLSIVSRTGYTGELGYEVFVPWSHAVEVALAIEEAGRAEGLVCCGLGARDSLRLEAGFSLYGHEIDDEITPVQAGLLWTVKFTKAVPFIGREALLREKEAGPTHRVVFFHTGDRRIVRPGTPVLGPDGVAGRVLSGTLSPARGEAIGSALVDAAVAGTPDPILAVEVRGQRLPLRLTRPPFVPLPKHA